MNALTFRNSDQDFTPAERKIANFLLQSSKELILYTSRDIADRLNISEATVSRFARHAGYADFKEMKTDLLCQADASHTPAEKLEFSLKRHDTSTPTGMLRYQQYCIEKTLEYLDEDYIQEIVGRIITARKVYLFGKGASASLASLLHFRLNRFGIDAVQFAGSGSEIFETLNRIRENDFVILFGFARVPAEAKTIQKYCRSIHCPTLLFDSQLIHDCREPDNYTLYVYRGDPSEYHSMAAPAALVDALVISIAAALGTDATASLEQLHSMKKAYQQEIPR